MRVYRYDPAHPEAHLSSGMKKGNLTREHSIICHYDIVTKDFLDSRQVFLYEYPVFVRNGADPDDRGCGDPGEQKSEYEKELIRRLRLRYSQQRSKRAIYDLAKSNRFDWFCTWTFDAVYVDRYDYSECAGQLGYWLDQMRRRYPDIRYIIVPELHSGQKDHHGHDAYHFHGLIGGVPDQELEFYRLDARTGRDLYGFCSFVFGINSASQVEDPVKAANYIGKYITKALTLEIRGQKRYWRSQNLILPQICRYQAVKPVCDVEAYGRQLEAEGKVLYQKLIKRYESRCLIFETAPDADLLGLLQQYHPVIADPGWIDGKYLESDVFDDILELPDM